jgi:hypothetical protein
MSPAKIEAVTMVMKRIASAGVTLVAHHGDCVGADEDFHAIAYGVDAIVETHPGPANRRDMRAFCDTETVHEPAGFFVRNRRIVSLATVMIATPFERAHQDHGGTWYTVDQALMRKKPLALVLPRPRGEVLIEFSGGWRWPELPKEIAR